ncbi:Uncharacterized protein PODLI_1B037181 [Podarcis lilfordi]|uniref:Uncharacterized protein n=1 Tax=Podarcis lilfordi TaxID=74358 RepID=A0AA35KK74_9SAUR|nr:Uncharacterized protein PODLI_1B037181 [Podarcis lilfordi]
MRAQHRFLLLTAAAVLLLAIVVADEPLSSPSPTSPPGSQTTEPMANSEPIISGKSEASGESEIGTPADPMTTGEVEAKGLDPLPGDAQSGPAMDVPAHSHESQERVLENGRLHRGSLALDVKPLCGENPSRGLCKAVLGESSSMGDLGETRLGQGLAQWLLLMAWTMKWIQRRPSPPKISVPRRATALVGPGENRLLA